MSLSHWLSERTGWPAIRAALLDRKIPSGGRWTWAYTLGSATLVAFLVQVVTGSMLALNYSPSPDHAFESIRHIMTAVPFGPWLRGLHHWGASAMIVLALLHLMRIYIMGSFKKPREVTWIVGVLLLLVIFGLGFTGYLLPWDQKAYWATAVGANISEQAPGLGPYIARILKGGEELGALTLTRFYAFHVLFLPMCLAIGIAVHLFLVVYHGISNPPHRTATPPDYQALKAAGKPFYPYAVFKDTVIMLLVVGVLLYLTIHFGVTMEDPADPSDSSYNPRPEWYFLFLFQALKYFPGSLETLAAIIVPTVLLLFLLLLPFLDRSTRRHPFARSLWMGIGTVLLFGFIWLTYEGWTSPLVNPRIENNPMVLQGKLLYDKLHCAYCHTMRGVGKNGGLELMTRIPTRTDDWLTAHFHKPALATPGSTMPEMHLLDEEIHALTAYLRDVGGGGQPSTHAVTLFRENCESCHRLHDRGTDVGPDLSRIGEVRSVTILRAYIAEPQGVNPDATMPGFADSLTPDDLESLARYLAAQRPATR